MTTTATETAPRHAAADWDVQCLQCHLIGPPSLIPDIGWGPHCADIKACTTRWAEGGIPQEAPVIIPPSPEAEDELKPLPIEEAASAAQERARQKLATWAPGETLSEEESAQEAGEGAPEEPGEAPAEPEADPGPSAPETDAPAAAEDTDGEVPD